MFTLPMHSLLPLYLPHPNPVMVLSVAVRGAQPERREKSSKLTHSVITHVNSQDGAIKQRTLFKPCVCVCACMTASMLQVYVLCVSVCVCPHACMTFSTV